MFRRCFKRLQGDRRTRHQLIIDDQINPREWYNWHPREYQPWYFDRHKWLYEQMQYKHFHHLLCHQVYLKDIEQLIAYPEPTTVLIDCRIDPSKMHRWVPTSHWLPRDEVEYALQLTDAEFLEMYGWRKPKQCDDIILLSHNGWASEEAGWEFKKEFFTHVYNFRAGINALYGESYLDFPPPQKLAPWKGSFPKAGIYHDTGSHREVLTRTGPFDRQYELDEFALPDLELEKPRHPEEGPRSHMPWGLQ